MPVLGATQYLRDLWIGQVDDHTLAVFLQPGPQALVRLGRAKARPPLTRLHGIVIEVALKVPTGVENPALENKLQER